MKVKVYPWPFCHTDTLDDEWLKEIGEDAVVGDVLKRLKYSIPIKILGLHMVNYKRVQSDARLKEGDIISIIVPTAGVGKTRVEAKI